MSAAAAAGFAVLAAISPGAPMFDLFGLLIKGFIYIWITIIATIPNAFMGGLTICVVATLLTYILREFKGTR